MPFAHRRRAVARGLQHLRDGHAVRIQRAAVAGEFLAPITRAGILRRAVGSHEPDARLVRIQPREQRRARRAAARAVVKLREPHPARRERVEIRRANLTAVAAEIRPPEIVGEDDEDVRFCGCDRGQRGPEAAKKKDQGQVIFKRLTLGSKFFIYFSSFSPLI